MLISIAATAQRHVIHVPLEDGTRKRIDTHAVKEILANPATQNVEATMADGSTLTWPQRPGERMTFDFLPPRLIHYTQSVENDNVHRYITEVQYDPDDYEYSRVLDYTDHTVALDEPHPLTIRLDGYRLAGGEYALVSSDAHFAQPTTIPFVDGEARIWNATPGDTLYYQAMSADNTTVLQEGIIVATGQVRMIYAPSVNNIRDLGGWPVEGGGHIRYGRIYRGAKFHDATTKYLDREDSIRMRRLNIKCEFDLRGGSEAANGNTLNYYSRLGRDVDYKIVGHGMYAYVSAVATYPEYFRYGWNLIKTHVFDGDPIFMHCSAGCDRAGTWSMVIEGVLGMSENDLNLDYELSTFALNPGKWRYRNIHQTVPDYDFRETIGYIKSLPGETLRDKFEYFLVEKCRIPKADIDRLRQEMIEY